MKRSRPNYEVRIIPQQSVDGFIDIHRPTIEKVLGLATKRAKEMISREEILRVEIRQTNYVTEWIVLYYAKDNGTVTMTDQSIFGKSKSYAVGKVVDGRVTWFPEPKPL